MFVPWQIATKYEFGYVCVVKYVKGISACNFQRDFHCQWKGWRYALFHTQFSISHALKLAHIRWTCEVAKQFLSNFHQEHQSGVRIQFINNNHVCNQKTFLLQQFVATSSLWFIMRKCMDMSFWISIGDIGYDFLNKWWPNPSGWQPNWFLYAFYHHESQWSQMVIMKKFPFDGRVHMTYKKLLTLWQ